MTSLPLALGLTNCYTKGQVNGSPLLANPWSGTAYRKTQNSGQSLALRYRLSLLIGNVLNIKALAIPLTAWVKAGLSPSQFGSVASLLGAAYEQ